MPQSASPLKLDDFSGGINEDHIGANLNQCQVCDNLLITSNKKLEQRFGSKILDSAAPRPASRRENSLFDFSGENYSTVENKIFRKTSGAWTELTGPDGNPGLGVGYLDTHISRSTWNNHLFLTGDAGGKVQKIYRDETNTIQIRTAGMPFVIDEDNFIRADKLATMIMRATDIKAALNTHFTNNTTAHNAGDFASAALLPSIPPTTEATLYSYIGSLLKAYDSHFQDFFQEKRTYHTSPAASPAVLASAQLDTTFDPTSFLQAQDYLNDLFIKMNQHSGDYDIHNNNKVDLIDPAINLLLTGISTGPLPEKSIQHVYDLANELKARINLHFANAVIHNSAELDTITADDATTDYTLMLLTEDIRLKYTQHIENASIHDAADTTNVLSANSSLKSSPSFTADLHNGLGMGTTEEILTELISVRTKFNTHDATAAPVHNVVTVSLYQVTNNVTASATYLYTFFYSFDYTVGPKLFTDNGPTLEKSVASTAPIGNYSQTISALSKLENGVQDNYDESAITIQIYRTTNGGTIFYKVGEVANGTLTFTDTVTDTDLVLQELLYTTGGVLSNDPPPVCKTLHILGDTALYGYITDIDGTVLKNRIRQSNINDPDSCPSSLFDDLEDDIVAISSAKNRFVVLCEKSIYRTEGAFDGTGRGFLRHEKIADVGCVSANSVVRTEFGIFFAGTNGFYFSDGFQVQRVSGTLEESYKKLIRVLEQRKRIYGDYDALTRRVWWAVQENPNAIDNDTCWVFHLLFGIKEDGAFTKQSNGEHFKPSAIHFVGEEMLRGDNRGYVFIHSKDYKNDPKVDTTAAVTTWSTKAVIYDWKSVSLDFGSIQSRKWGSRINFVGRDISNESVQIKNINDDRKTTSLTPIRFRGNILWGDPSILWGDETILWGGNRGFIDEWRRNTAGSLRFNFKQIEVTNANVVIDTSAAKGLCTVNGTTNVATLNTARRSFPKNPEDYTISFEGVSGGLTREFTITAHTDTTNGGDTFTTSVTFSDPDSLVTGTLSSQEWVIRGKPKNERLHVQSLNIQWSPLTPGKSQSAYGGTAESGEITAT